MDTAISTVKYYRKNYYLLSYVVTTRRIVRLLRVVMKKYSGVYYYMWEGEGWNKVAGGDSLNMKGFRSYMTRYITSQPTIHTLEITPEEVGVFKENVCVNPANLVDPEYRDIHWI